MSLPYFLFFNSFPIAIKTCLKVDPEEFDSILDEAKSMFQVGKYHNHIVNLQGITFGEDDEKLSQVGFSSFCSKV